MRDRDVVLPLVLLVAFGVGAAFFLVPQGELDQEARLTSLSEAQALNLLNAAKEPLSPPLAFRQAELTAAAGNGALADRLLAGLIARTGQTASIAAARADLAFRSGNLRQGADYLAAAHSLVPNDRQRQKLADIYRQLGDRAAERKTLSSVPVTELSASERMRLVDLMAADGATAEALEVAHSALSLAGQDAPALAERFAALALSTEQSDLLIQTTATWLIRPDGPAVTMSIAKVMTVRPRFAKTFAAAVVSQVPEARALLAKTFTEVRLYDAARLMLQPWVDFGSMTPEGWEAVVLYADRSGDTGPLKHLLQQMPVQEQPPKNGFLPLIRYDGEGALLPYQLWLTPAYLEGAPLVEAAWALTRQRPDEAFFALQRSMQTTHDQMLWHALALRLHGTEYFDRLQAQAGTAFDLKSLSQGGGFPAARDAFP